MKKVKETASQLLRRILSKQFFRMNLGILDVCHLLGSFSKQLQKVEHFPWRIPKIQLRLLYNLEKCRKFSQNEAEIATLACYHMLTSLRKHLMVMPQRTLGEVCVVNYNPHLSLATIANHEAEVVCYTPALSEAYVTKGSGSKEALYTAADELRKMKIP